MLTPLTKKIILNLEIILNVNHLFKTGVVFSSCANCIFVYKYSQSSLINKSTSLGPNSSARLDELSAQCENDSLGSIKPIM